MSCGKNCSCKGEDSRNKDDSRRNFLKSYVASFGTGHIGSTLLNSIVSCKENNKPSGEKINVLTQDRKHISVNKSEVADFKLYISESNVRNGIPGKKFVMVIVLGKYAFLDWFTMIAGLVIPVILLSFKKIQQSISGVVSLAVLVLIGALINSYLIVTQNMLNPFIPIQHALPGYNTYNPTLIEWIINASSLAGFLLVIILLFKLFHVINMWEVIESVEESSEKEVGIANCSSFQFNQSHATN